MTTGAATSSENLDAFYSAKELIARSDRRSEWRGVRFFRSDKNSIGISGVISHGPKVIWDFAVAMRHIAEDGEITLELNSCGGFGDTNEQIAILLEPIRDRLTVIALRFVASAAAELMCNIGKRVLVRSGCIIMIHSARWHPPRPATRPDDDRILARLNVRIAEIFHRRTGMSVETINAMLREEFYMDAETAVELGFADEVIPGGPPSPDAMCLFDEWRRRPQ